MLDGRAIAAQIRESVLPDVHAFTARAGRPPGLGIVLVGDDPSSEIYVRNKVRTGTESGLWVDLQRLPATATLDELLALVARLNASAVHDGILVQSPLPAAMGRGAAQRVFDAIDPAKDVDGFHPMQRRPARAGARAPDAVHAVRHHRAARPERHRDVGRARGGDRPQRDRRETDGDAAAAAGRDGDDLPLENTGPRGRGVDRRHPGGRDRPSRLRDARRS